MDMPNELYVASFTEYIDGRLDPACIIGIYGDAEHAKAAVAADMDEFAEDMSETWTVDKLTRRAWDKNDPSKRRIKWGVEVASVAY